VLDFYCEAARLAVEVDARTGEHDRRRDARLREHGIEVLRIPVPSMMRDTEAALRTILAHAERRLNDEAMVSPKGSLATSASMPGTMELTDDHLAQVFLAFAATCEGRSPLYHELAARIASDPEVLDLARHTQQGQPRANLVFGAVHELLSRSDGHALAAYYPSLSGVRSEGDPADAWPAFRDFCMAHRDEIIAIVSTRRVQTNEVGRCGLLMPAFAHAQQRFERPLHLIEVGASAGLNLLLDRYHYRYSTGHDIGPGSEAMVRTEVRGDRPLALPTALPPIAERVGIDIAPVDVTDVDAMRWIEALIWPDDLDRLELHRAARTIARASPPRLIEGDGMALAFALLEEVGADVVPCVFHTHTTCQMTRAWRETFADRLGEVGATRDLIHISLECLVRNSDPRLDVTWWAEGQPTHIHFADCDHHGKWMRAPGARDLT
jgi:hypothetical protein